MESCRGSIQEVDKIRDYRVGFTICLSHIYAMFDNGYELLASTSSFYTLIYTTRKWTTRSAWDNDFIKRKLHYRSIDAVGISMDKHQTKNSSIKLNTWPHWIKNITCSYFYAVRTNNQLWSFFLFYVHKAKSTSWLNHFFFYNFL